MVLSIKDIKDGLARLLHVPSAGPASGSSALSICGVINGLLDSTFKLSVITVMTVSLRQFCVCCSGRDSLCAGAPVIENCSS